MLLHNKQGSQQNFFTVSCLTKFRSQPHGFIDGSDAHPIILLGAGVMINNNTTDRIPVQIHVCEQIEFQFI